MISVIIPFYNEKKILASSVGSLRSYLESLPVLPSSSSGYEIILYDDSSTDGSREVADSLANKNIRVLHSSSRVGKGQSIRESIEASKGEIVAFIDADLSADPTQLSKLISKLETGADVAIGSRLAPGAVVRGRKSSREFFSRHFNSILGVLFGSRIKDHQCGFKAFRRSRILPLLPLIQNKRWFWDTEMLIRAQQKGYRIDEVPIIWQDRADSTVRLPTNVIYMVAMTLQFRIRLWLFG